LLHEFALSLNCTVAELRQRMPHREWLDWLAFFRSRPMPQQRTDYLLGEILSAIKNQGAFTKVERRVDAFDEVPRALYALPRRVECCVNIPRILSRRCIHRGEGNADFLTSRYRDFDLLGWVIPSASSQSSRDNAD